MRCGNRNTYRSTRQKVDITGQNKKMIERALHPIIWWVWAGAIAIALAQTNRFLFSCAVLALAALVVQKKSEDVTNAPWVRSFNWALKLGLWIVMIRVAVGVLIGVPSVGSPLMTLPTIPLPTWMAGVRIGGVVTQERVIATAREGIMLAAIVGILAAASSLTNPHRLLRALPVVIYEFGVAVVIATTVVPQLVASIHRIREAQRLRGQNLKSIKSWKKVALPVLEESLSRSLDLAASMDARGYGISRRRSRYRATKWQRNEYFIAFFALVSLIYPISALLLVALPLYLAPNLRIATRGPLARRQP